MTSQPEATPRQPRASVVGLIRLIAGASLLPVLYAGRPFNRRSSGSEVRFAVGHHHAGAIIVVPSAAASSNHSGSFRWDHTVRRFDERLQIADRGFLVRMESDSTAYPSVVEPQKGPPCCD